MNHLGSRGVKFHSWFLMKLHETYYQWNFMKLHWNFISNFLDYETSKVQESWISWKQFLGAGEGLIFLIYFSWVFSFCKKTFWSNNLQIKISKISPYCSLPQTYSHRYGRSHKQTGTKTYIRRLAYTKQGPPKTHTVDVPLFWKWYFSFGLEKLIFLLCF